MSSFSQYDLRVINRFIQQLKTEHGIQLEYQDSTLGQKLYQIVTEKDNDGLNILWDSLSLEFRAASIPSKKQPKEKGRKSYFYRGNKVESSAAENTSEQAVDGCVDKIEKAEEIEGVNGHYITYRGKQKWLAK